eukprot:GFUD01001209.1.p1 GENE.GFUD01001209.1~~GFUD01001209.1.p1  ORF type:complete len:528 (-),score=171.53 GFUD01001209.1:155-1738(-)
MSRARLLESPDCDPDCDSDQDESDPSPDTADLVQDTIGSFGLYQLWLCFLGFLFNVVHCWLSLSLKFVGLVPQFVCGEGDSPGEDACMAYMGNTSRPCTTFVFSKEEVVETIVERWGLVCDKAGLENVAQSVFFTGCLVGVFLAGLMADRMGRKVVCVVLVITFLISGVLGGLVNSWYLWLVLRFVVGAASIGMVTVRYTIQVEMVGGSWRSWANTLASSGWVVGYMTLPMLAYSVPNMRQMEVLLGLAVSPLLLLLVFCHPESPRWLLSKGRVDRAVTILNRVASWNSRRKMISEEHFLKFISSHSTVSVTTNKPIASSGLSSLFTSRFPTTRLNLFIMSFCWFSFGMAYFGLALHTPELGSNVFIVFFIGGLMDVPVIIVVPFLLNHCGRKPCMVGGLLVGSICLLATSLLSSTSEAIIVMAVLGKMGVGCAFDTGYVWTSEMFPTVIRNSSLATCSSFARLGAILAPLVVFTDMYRPGMSILVYGMVAMVGGMVSVGLQPETKGCKMLPDTMEEGERAAQRRRL